MTDNAGDTAATGANLWDKLTFAVKGDKGTATADGWVNEAAGPVGGFLMDLETAEGLVAKSLSQLVCWSRLKQTRAAASARNAVKVSARRW